MCPVGQKRYAANETCMDCEMNTFNNETGQDSCKACPAAPVQHITFAKKSNASTDCIRK